MDSESASFYNRNSLLTLDPVTVKRRNILILGTPGVG